MRQGPHMRRACVLGALLLAMLAGACSQSPRPAPQTAVVGAAAPQVAAPAATAPPSQNWAPGERTVAAAQRALAQLGYNVGKADGVCGPATRRAILAFQKDHALAQDGRLSPALTGLLNTLAAQLPKTGATAAAAGDTVLYGDGSSEIVDGDRVVPWDQDGGRVLVAIRPSTAGWPPAARAGLDWATSHALDVAGGPPIAWSSTGVDRHFAIYATSALSAREAALAGEAAPSCRHFELRGDGAQMRYPGLACRDANGDWYFPRSRIWLAHPATGLGSQTVSGGNTVAPQQ